MNHDDKPADASEDRGGAGVSGDAPNAVMGVGDRLRVAREARNLSIADVSQTIKISARVLELVEGNAWSQLAGHTFARGVVRSYAKLVQIEPEPLLKELESAPLPKLPLLELPRSTDAALPVPGEANKRDRVATLSGVLLVAAAIVAYYIIPDDLFSRASVSAKSKPATPVAVTERGGQQPVVPGSASLPAPVPEPAQGIPTVQALPAPPVAPVSTAVEASSPSAAALVLQFTENSWAEIRDAGGAILISENVTAGSERNLVGTAPYSLWFGNADGVRVVFRGQSIDLRPHTRQKVARLTLE